MATFMNNMVSRTNQTDPALSSADQSTSDTGAVRTAREWMVVLAKYRTPNAVRAVLEIFLSVGPFIGLWIAAYFALSVHYALSLVLCLASACFLVRVFIIQHDCGHGSFLKSKRMNDWIGRCLGVLTLTPYMTWQQAHKNHHGSSGNLDRRGMGDIDTLTVDEYLARSPKGRFAYRLYRHPLVMFGIGPAFIFLLHYRLPIGFMKSGWRYWASTLGTTFFMVLASAIIVQFIGFKAFAMIYFPVALMAATMGVWMFFVQHQFEDAVWEHDEDWNLQDAALYGSSYYDLPAFLPWLTGYIGIHHVHHLNSRIPFYKLKTILKDHTELTNLKRIKLVESFKCVRFQLWCEAERRMVSFKDVMKRMPAE